MLKVFLFDTRQLQDEWRVLSYFGLGVSLLALAWVYQKHVFGGGLKIDGEGSMEPNRVPSEPKEPEFESDEQIELKG